MEEIRKVLLVDDEDIDLFLNTVLLKTVAGAEEVIVARDGAVALEFLDDNCSASRGCSCELDLILLDLNMPTFGGFGFLEEYGRMRLACAPRLSC